METVTPLYDEEYYKELYKFLEQYDDYNIPDIEIDTVFTSTNLLIAQNVMLALSVVIGFLALVVFSTVLSEKARSVSASWYIYSLALETVILSLVFTPLVHTRDFYASIHHFCRVEDTRMSLGLLRAINIVCINTEITFCIMMPLSTWTSSRFKRFLVTLCSMWVIAFVFADMILPSLHEKGCHGDNHVATIVIHVLLNWVPGLIVLGLTVVSIISYFKGCFLRQSNTSSRDRHLQERMRAHEWFICLMILNAQFLLFDLVLVDVIDNTISHNIDHLMNVVYVTIAHELIRLVLPLSLLAISSVRSALYEAVKIPYRLVVRCRKEGSQDEEALTMSSPLADQSV